MTLAIEPMVNLGGYQTRTLADGWTVVTADGSALRPLRTHRAHDGKGPEILTVPPVPAPVRPSAPQ